VEERLLASGDYLTFAQVADHLGGSPAAVAAQITQWVQAGQVFTLVLDGAARVPRYALAGLHPHPGLAPVLHLLAPRKSGLQLAAWFDSACGFLGGRRPRDLLATEPAQVRAAAQDERIGPVHG